MKDIKVIEQKLSQYLPTIEEKTDAHISHGGCDWFAYHLASELQKLGVPCTIHAYYYNIIRHSDGKVRDHMDLNAEIQRNGGEDVDITHVVVKVGDHFYDSNGQLDESDIDTLEHGINMWLDIMTAGHLEIYHRELTIEEAEKLWHSTGWNDEFDKSQMPVIEKMLSKLSEVIN